MSCRGAKYVAYELRHKLSQIIESATTLWQASHRVVVEVKLAFSLPFQIISTPKIYL